MPQLIERIADLIGLRDRDALDVALTRIVWDLLGPGARAVAILRPVGDEADTRWLTRIRFSVGQVTPAVNHEIEAPSRLPKLCDLPYHQDTIACGQIFRHHGASALTLFPLSAEHEGLGVFEVETELPLMREAEHLLGSVLRIYHNFQGLLDYGERDALTNLLNRKTFDGAFLKTTIGAQEADALNHAERRDGAKGSGHWLGVIDIDYFKRVNDGFGHLIGDEVLILMARLMRSSFRSQDTIYRFGGEEFAVMVQANGESDATAAFERLRHNAAQHRFPQVGQITVSTGFTALRSDDTPSEAFERADKAVYHAKRNGRNQVCNHADLVATGEVVEVAGTPALAEFF